jgi:site-specific recombinase XerD
MTGRMNFAPLLEGFFTQRLMQQRQASRHTIAAYRDTFRLLLYFIQTRLHKAPSALALEDIDAPLVAAFLDDMEKVRGAKARTRNLRLTAVHSFFRYAALPTRAGHPGQTLYASPGAFPEPTGGRRPPGRARPADLVGAA